ncbi:MAG: hypothetical protein MUF74_00015 [Cypionkella sp.]|nr:hypothetical protein [Cypionkella sp.]
MTTGKETVSRRQLLARLGLAAGAAYVAPTMLGMNAARASGASRGGNSGPSGGGNRGGGASRNSGPSRSRSSRNSGPSRNGPSRNSGPSRGNRNGQNRATSAEMPIWMRRMLGI